MIVKALMDMIYVVLTTMLGFIHIPPWNPTLSNAIDAGLDLIFNNCSIITFFVHWNTVLVLLPFVIGIIALEKYYYYVLWVLKKIPVLGLE